MDSSTTSNLVLFVNGKRAIFSGDVDPKTTLLQYLRSSGLTGTKLGCGEGGCGACTVMLSVYDSVESKIKHFSANACLTPICALHGHHVTTVEGIGSMKRGLHPVQKRLAALHGSQCGFCTPGIVMAVYSILRQNPRATPHEIESSLDGNLCRCTGYRPILDAAKSLSSNKGASKGSCCRGGGSDLNQYCPCAAAESESASSTEETTGGHKHLVHLNTEKTIHEHKAAEEESAGQADFEPIFPPALMQFSPTPLLISKNGTTWFQPATILQLLQFKNAHPTVRIVVGNTEVGIETKFKGSVYPHLMNPSAVSELKSLSVEETGVRVGSAVTLTVFQKYLSSLASGVCEPWKCRGFVAIVEMLHWFASNHIRNVAAIGGNIMTASPISDLNPMLCACGAILRMASLDPTDNSKIVIRDVPISTFFKSYRVVDVTPTEVLQDIFIPFTKQWEFVVPQKQAKRREDDISIVTAGIRFDLAVDAGNSEGGWGIRDCAFSFGGMAPTTVFATGAQTVLTAQPFNATSIRAACSRIISDMTLPLHVPGGKSSFRSCLAASFLYRSFLTICHQLSQSSDIGNLVPSAPSVSADEASASLGYLNSEKILSRGEQEYFMRTGGLTNSKHESVGDSSSKRAPVGDPLPHRSGELQCSGEAKYTDDIPSPQGTFYAAVVTSAKAHARIRSVNTDACRGAPGFIAYFDHNSVTGHNEIGPIHEDEEVFVSSEAKHVGQIIALVVALSHEEALQAARLVKIEYEELPAVINIDDAIKSGSFFPSSFEIANGNVDAMEQGSDIIVSGSMNVGGQEHFYLETNCCLAVPTERGELEIHASTQNLNETQLICARATGLPASHISCRVKRIGGGFGGKETRTVIFSAPVALAAHILGAPVRINVERDLDMQLTGQRHAFSAKYRAGCKADGTITFLDTEIFSNGGFSYDLSEPVMGRALLHIDGVYRWPALRAVGRICKTNQPSHTAFRGFGGPQGMVVVETVMEHLYSEVRKRYLECAVARSIIDFRLLNLYREGDETHFGTRLVDFNVPDALQQVINKSNVHARELAVKDFNKQNRWKKRGIYILPTKYGINYTAKFMNQGGALIHIYRDGTVLASHGGMEMGQGIHTKMIQVVAHSLNIPHELVHISESSTNTVSNATPSAGSMTTDMYGMALLNACEQLNERLKPIIDSNPTSTWIDIVNKAYFSRVDLSAHGFYKVPDDRCGFDWTLKNCAHNSERGTPFNYFTQGAACTEVEIDCLSGDCRIIRTDVVMDVGQSINPAIDVGQIEGAFIQGFGWCTMEELVWGDPDHKWVAPGNLFTRGPGTYKIPSFNDVPEDFRVYLMDKSNKRAVHSSKGIGEPPFFMACSAFFAIRNAIKDIREESGNSEYFQFNLPATSERIRMSCPDPFSEQAVGGGDKFWSFQAQGSW